jgi:hypothetical protein
MDPEPSNNKQGGHGEGHRRGGHEQELPLQSAVKDDLRTHRADHRPEQTTLPRNRRRKDRPEAQQADLGEREGEEGYDEDVLETEGRMDRDGGQDGSKEPENDVGCHQPDEPPVASHDRFPLAREQARLRSSQASDLAIRL